MTPLPPCVPRWSEWLPGVSPGSWASHLHAQQSEQMTAVLQDGFRRIYIHTQCDQMSFLYISILSVFNLSPLKIFYWVTTLSWCFLSSLLPAVRLTAAVMAGEGGQTWEMSTQAANWCGCGPDRTVTWVCAWSAVCHIVTPVIDQGKCAMKTSICKYNP